MIPISSNNPHERVLGVKEDEEDQEVQSGQGVAGEDEDGPDSEHMSLNAASPVVHLLVQARKDSRKLTSTSTASDISSIVQELQQAETLTVNAPFNPHKELHFLHTILDKANALQTKITDLTLPASSDLTSLITTLQNDITTVEGKIQH